MKNVLFFLIVSFYACAFASEEKLDVDQYITRLRRVLPEFPAACFVNVCDNTTRNYGEIHFTQDKYFFVNAEYVAECSKKGLENELGGSNGTVYGEIKEILRFWMKDRQYKFVACADNVNQVMRHREESIAYFEGTNFPSMGLYKRDSFLNACLQSELAKRLASKQTATRSASVLRQRPIPTIAAVVKAEGKQDEKVTQVVDNGITLGDAMPNSALEEKSAASSFLAYSSTSASAVAPIDYSAIAKELTASQLAALSREYAGRGMSFKEQYEQACLDDLFAKLREPSPRRNSVSRSPGKPRSVSKSPAKRDAAYNANEEITRFSSPARARPFSIFYESPRVEQTYNEFFQKAQNTAAKTHFNDFTCAISTRGLVDYMGKIEKFNSIPGVYKIKVGDRARILFKRGEGDSIILMGDPDHYGDA